MKNAPSVFVVPSSRAARFRRSRLILSALAAVVLAFGTVQQAHAQTTYDWLNTAPDGNWTQGAFGARWSPGGLFDIPPFGVLRFNNDQFPTMTNNVGGTLSMNGIIFGSSAIASRTLTGNPVQLFDFSGADPFIRNESTNTHIISLNLAGDGDAVDPLQIQLNSSGGLTFNGSISNQGSWIDITGTTTSTNSPTVTFNGVISGSAGINKLNANTVAVLAATNTYTNLTQISAGILIITNTGGLATNSAVQISNGARLTLWRTSGNNLTFSNAVSGAGQLRKEGNGTVTLASSNTYTGGTVVREGSLVSGTNGAFGLGGLTIDGSLAVARVQFAGTTNTFTNFSAFGANNQVFENAGASGSAGRAIFDLASGVNASVSSLTFIRDSASGGFGTLAITKLGAGTLNLFSAGLNGTYSGGLTISNGTVRVGTNAGYALGLGTITMAGGTVEYATNVTATTNVFSAVSLTASTTNTFAVTNSGGELFLNGAISGSGTLVKAGAGTLVLGAANSSLSGALTISNGTLVAGNTAVSDINTASAINLNGGNLEIRGRTADKTYNSAPITVNNTAVIAYNNTNTTTLQLTLSGGAFVVNTNLTLSNISATTTNFNQFNISRNITGAGNISISSYNNMSAITNDFRLGRVQFSGDNSGYNGNITVARGNFQLAPGAGINSLGTGTFTLGTTGDSFGAALGFNTANSPTLTNNIVVATGGFRAIKDNSLAGGGANIDIALNGNITLNGNLTVDQGLAASRTFTLGGNITGAGALDVTRTQGNATSRLVITGAATHTGGTTIASNATVAIGNNGTTGSVAGNIAISNTGSLIFNRSDNLSYTSSITGAGTVQKAGAGTLTLTGGNSYTGATVVTNGTLNLARTGAESISGTTNVTVNTGAKLLISQSDQVNNSATVTLSGGTIAKGSGAIIETFGVLTLGADSTLDFGAGTGSFTFSTYNPASFVLKFDNFNVGNSLTVTTGTFNASEFNFNSFDYNQTTVGAGFTITAVPEPSTVAAAAGLLSLMAWGSLRRRLGRKR